MNAGTQGKLTLSAAVAALIVSGGTATLQLTDIAFGPDDPYQVQLDRLSARYDTLLWLEAGSRSLIYRLQRETSIEQLQRLIIDDEFQRHLGLELFEHRHSSGTLSDSLKQAWGLVDSAGIDTTLVDTLSP